MGAKTRHELKSYHSIASDLINRISSGAVPEGSFLPIEKDLMAEYGVTRTTVRRALTALANEGFGQPIPNKGVVAIRKGSPASKAVAFVDGSTLVLRSLYSKLNAAFLQLGYHLVHIDSQVIGLENALMFSMDRGFDGAFVWSFEGFPDCEVVKKAQDRMPIVVLDHRLRGMETDLITFDYLQMAYEAVEHLVRSGRRRIAVTGMFDMLDITHERFCGYMKALFRNGFQPDVRDYVFCYTSGYPEPNHEHLMNRLKAKDRPDAIFVMQDEFVPGVVDAVFQCGLSIPEDISIATIGDDVIVSVGGQSISAVHCDWESFAQDAMDLMLERLHNRSSSVRTIMGKHQLVPGTAARNGAHSGIQHAGTYVVTRHKKGQTAATAVGT